MDAALEDRHLAVTDLIAGGVVGMNVEHAALATRHQRRHVVHPGVVAAQLTTADQDQTVLAGLRVESVLEGGNRLQHAGRGEVDALVPVVEPSLDARLERAEVDAVGRGLELLEAEPIRPREEAVAVGPEP